MWSEAYSDLGIRVMTWNLRLKRLEGEGQKIGRTILPGGEGTLVALRDKRGQSGRRVRMRGGETESGDI